MRGILIIFLLVFLAGCSDIDEYLPNGFEIYSFKGNPNNRNVLYNDQEIFSRQIVGAMGFNESYIIVKTYKEVSAGEINMDSVKYYIVNMDDYGNDPNQEESKGVLGPYTMKEFLAKKHELKIDDLNFTRVYDDEK